MEIDELKLAWQTLDRRLERQFNLDAHVFRDAKLDRLRSSLRPLLAGQVLQVFFGIAFILLAALLWSRKPDVLAVIVAGVTVHAYGISCIIFAGVTIGQIRRLDYSAPVLDIQKQMGRLRRTYVVSGLVAGMPWWFLWVPVLSVMLALLGVDLYARAPSVIWIGLGIGALGLALTYWLANWVRRSTRRPRLARAVEDSLTGESLRKAQRVLDEIAEFERS